MRRQKGEGSITKLSDTKARVRVNVVINGIRRPISKTVPLRDAPRVLQELQRYKDNRQYVIDKGVTVQMIYDEWIENIKRTKSHNTYVNYMSRFKPFLDEYQYVKITAITQQGINEFLERLFTQGKAPSTVAQTKAMLRTYFRYCVIKKAMMIDPLDNNYAYDLEHPKKRRVLGDIHIIPDSDLTVIKKLAMSIYNNKRNGTKYTQLYLYPTIILGDDSGMRRSEMLALKESDIDFETHRISVTNSVHFEAQRGAVIGDTKTSSSHRFIYVSNITINLLRELLDKKKVYNYTPSPYVFSKTNGELIEPNIMSSAFKRLLKRAKVSEEYSLHDLRHTSATRLIMNGINIKTVSLRLGHKSITTTLNIYSHYVAFNDQLSANIYDKLGHL